MAHLFDLRIIGPFGLSDPSGRGIMIGRKAQAILAMLAVEMGKPVAKARLQATLWPDADHARGRDSLKKALKQLRRTFGPDWFEMIEDINETLTLRPGRLRVDLHDPAFQPDRRIDLLEGLQVSTEGFDDWLQETTARFAARLCPPLDLRGEEPAEAHGGRTGRPEPALARTALAGASAVIAYPAHLTPHDTPTQRRIIIAIRPITKLPIIGPSAPVSDVVIERLGAALEQAGMFQIRDLRDDPRFTGGDADVVLTTRATSDGGVTHLHLALLRPSDKARVWSGKYLVHDRGIHGDTVTGLINRMVEEIGARMVRAEVLGASEVHAAARFAIDGIERMFRLKPCELQKSAASLKAATEIDPQSAYFAWSAFLTSFRLEESKGANLKELREYAHAIARQAYELDPWNPTTRSLLTHVYAFIQRDFAQAGEMMSPLLGHAPDTPMFYQSAAMLYFYTGDLERARMAARRATVVGRQHAFSYAFSTSVSMIDFLRGDLPSAIHFGERAVAQRRGETTLYQPTLRYLAAAYASSGDGARARSTWSELVRIDPANTVAALADRNFPVPSEQARTALMRGHEALARMIDDG